MRERDTGGPEWVRGEVLWTRRALLGGLAGVVVGALACRRKVPGSVGSPGSNARFEGYSIHRLDGLLTPTRDFFVRDHFGVPAEAEAAAADWSLCIEGDVRTPLRLGLAELRLGQPIDRPVTLECAGNGGRNGPSWAAGGRADGGVSTATFQGVSLAELLQRAGPLSSVQEIVFEGADAGAEREADGWTERQPFARSVPLVDALLPSALLATGMNGGALPSAHGGPLRVILPGRYATDSVKWVKRIRAVSVPFEGFYQRQRYRRATAIEPAGVALGRLRVQSEIARPRADTRLPLGLLVDVVGAAWGGSEGVARVEVSTDGGASFAEAELLDAPQPGCWRRWRWRWRPDQVGPRLLVSRAFDQRGVGQPFKGEDELGTSYSLSGSDRIQYANNAVPMVPVRVV